MLLTRLSVYNFIKKNKISRINFIFYCVAISLIIYFAIVSIFGEKGIIKYYLTKKDFQKIEQQKVDLENKINQKREMIEGMNYESLDLDLVDEQSRKILGYVGKDEIVIYQDKTKK